MRIASFADVPEQVKFCLNELLLLPRLCGMLLVPARPAMEATMTGDARRALGAFGVTVPPVTITQRTGFATALIAGLTAYETEPEGRGAREMRALWRAVEKESHR